MALNPQQYVVNTRGHGPFEFFLLFLVLLGLPGTIQSSLNPKPLNPKPESNPASEP